MTRSIVAVAALLLLVLAAVGYPALADGAAAAAPSVSGAPTPIAEGDVKAAVGMVPQIVTAFSKGDYSLGFSLVLMVLVFAIRTYAWQAIPKKWIPVATAGLAAASSVSAGLMMGTPWLEALLNGTSTGLGAVGLFEIWKNLKTG